MALRTYLIGLTAPALLVGALLTACSDSASDAGAASPAPGSSANPPAGLPLATVPGTSATANGKTVEMGIGTYCWTQMCVDKIGPVTKGALDVSRGDVIQVAIPQGVPPLKQVNASAMVAGSPAASSNGEDIWSYPPTGGTALSAAIDAKSVDVRVDLTSGKYVLAVGMYFDSGDISYGVVLNVH